MLPMIVIVGPTAVGKTKLSVELALNLGGEIMNGDSMQIYQGMDVGTAKIKPDEKKGVKHHLFDIRSVEEPYSVYDYQKEAREKIEEIQKKGKLPILVGGTGYYIKAALYDYEFIEEKEIEHKELTDIEYVEEIKKMDPDMVLDIHNHKRLVRIYERLQQDYVKKEAKDHLLYPVIFVGLTMDREELYQRINDRVDGMMIDLIDEVQGFYRHGLKTQPLLTAIGYKELYPFLEGHSSLKECVALIKQNSRNYAKRQYTWFTNQMNIEWFLSDSNQFSNTIASVQAYIEEQINQFLQK